jgi:hypothetical protein
MLIKTTAEVKTLLPRLLAKLNNNALYCQTLTEQSKNICCH